MNAKALDRNVLSLSLFVPYNGIPHAGGEYVRRHYGQLAKSATLRVFAPRNEVNEDASILSATELYEVSLFDHFRPRRYGLAWLWLLLVKYIRGVSLGINVEQAARDCTKLRSAAQEADVIEFQWTETASLSRYFRKVAPSATQILVAHDILSQRWNRRFRTETGIRRRLFYFGRFVFTALAERRRFATVDTVVVFSDKDAALVRRIYGRADVRVVNPPLMDSGMLEQPSVHSSVENPMVLFTGALSRSENHEAIVWFLEEIWEELKDVVPNCVLTIAGADPKPELVELSRKYPDIRITGRVEDLAPFYKEADVFISPMFNGAGVKFKNITAMLWGLPIVSTSIGAEGIGSHDLYLSVTDDGTTFLQALTKALLDSKFRRSVSAKAQAWAFANYGEQQFAEQLRGIYFLPAPEAVA
jgi:glycosyltransferase involved in cell wall biosynthesis